MNRGFLNWHWFKNNSGVGHLMGFWGICFLLFFLNGCSGSVAYQVKWQDMNTLMAENGTINCEKAGVVSFYSYVYEPGDNTPIAETSWPCTGTVQMIPKVSTGSNYKVVIAAKDVNGYALYLGEKNNVNVHKDSVNYAGDIELTSFATKLAGKSDDGLLTWSEVKHASQYRIQIAEDIKFVNIVVNRLLDTTSYAPGLEASQVYFWRVAPISSTGIEGRLSEIFSFRF